MVAKKTPHQVLTTFTRACSLKGAVIVKKVPRRDAKDHFSLYPESMLLEFIANGGLENIKPDDTSTLDYDPPNGTDVGKPVYSYTFKIGPKHGYIAFYVNSRDKWVVKSFHPPVYGRHGEANKELTHNPFQKLLGEQI